MDLVIDTSAYSAFYRGQADLRPYFVITNNLFIPHVVIGELRAGFASGTRQSENNLMLDKFLDQPNVNILFPTLSTCNVYAQMFALLRRAGTPIGFNDMWIASVALEQDLPLLTLDKDFSNIPDLMLA